MEKSKILDKEVLLRRQVESEYEKLQKKWDMIVQGENPASQQLVDEVEELRVKI
jgi:E3 ubiquitin-protein ligase BRE1